MSKWKLWGYPISYWEHRDDFVFAIQNNECIEIAGNYVPVNYQGNYFEMRLMESCIWNPDLGTLIPPYIIECGNMYEELRSR